MLRTMFAIVAAGLIFAAVSGTSQAAPIAPLPAGVISDTDVTTPVYYRYYHRYHHRYYHRHCWWHRGYRVCR